MQHGTPHTIEWIGSPRIPLSPKNLHKNLQKRGDYGIIVARKGGGHMVKVAIVEDERSAAAALEEHLSRFSKENGAQFSVQLFPDAMDFLENYHPDYQIVFMDIEMPFLNGMDAAKRLREIDPVVALVFITNMAQFAIKGYEVEALGFVLKPVSYYRFSSLLQKILRRLDVRQEQGLTIRTPNSMVRIPAYKVLYVSVEDHLLLYHTDDGIIEAWGSLKTALDELPEDQFVQINKSCIVNLRHIKGLSGNKVIMGTPAELVMSRSRRQEVINTLNRYLAR